ncbi:hypothetical protein SAMN05444422_1063 [Halobiforma haloterrestris]|uniref:Uncharacterized protein n=1 Tax=Natronobacterium haloterrestre TaxID=148448 RepID=A0A1I1HIH5_NATHA|nr:hypothetical protein SAMN05444422_1063 [Halobiforma haloterrestris]
MVTDLCTRNNYDIAALDSSDTISLVTNILNFHLSNIFFFDRRLLGSVILFVTLILGR